jgi:hypothetical protein
MTDLTARADRVRQIATALYGKILDRRVEHIEELVDDEIQERDIDVMVIEVPADLLGAAMSMLGQGGFTFNIGKQSTRMAPHAVAVEQNPHAAAIFMTRLV